MKALRTILAGSALLALSMTSCTADEQISQNTTDGAIRFSVNTANQTRAAHSYCANEMPAYFNVYADYTADGSKKLYIDGDEVNQVEGNMYQSAALRYWPEKDYPFNFYAYVDAAGSFKYNSGTPIFENFTVESDVNNQLDLMYATVIGMQQGDGGKYGTVELNFRHALSQICYKAKNENPNIEITINSITISGIGGTGTYNFPSNSTTGNYEHHTDDKKAPASKFARGGWETIAESSQTSSYSVTPEDGLIPSDGTAKGLTTFSSDNTDESHIQTGDTKTYSNALNLIPQDRSMASVAEASTTPTNGAYFTLNLTIKNNLNKSENQVGEKTTIVANKDFYVPADIKWKQGNRYIYTFNFDKDWQGLTPITYTVSVDDFVTTSEIELPRKNVIKGTTKSSEAFNISVNGSPKNVTPDETPISEGSYNFYVDLGPDELESLNFTECTTITSLDLSGVDTSKVTDMSQMFSGCSSLTTLDVSNFDTSKVTGMSSMFYNCSSLTTLDLSSFDTSQVTNMDDMFRNCEKLTELDVSNFDTSKVATMSYMFFYCTALTTVDVSNFDTSSVITMSMMFHTCENLTELDVSKFDTSKVTDMSYMFAMCSALTTLDVDKFDTSKVTDMSWMFGDCSSLTKLNVSNFDTSNVLDMCYMFYNCSSLTTLDVSNFNTSVVTNMSKMFTFCGGLQTLDLSSFDTSKVTDMEEMFSYCNSLETLDLSSFDTSQVTNMKEMFSYCSSLTTLNLSGFTASESLNYYSNMFLDVTATITTSTQFKKWAEDKEFDLGLTETTLTDASGTETEDTNNEPA